MERFATTLFCINAAHLKNLYFSQAIRSQMLALTALLETGKKTAETRKNYFIILFWQRSKYFRLQIAVRPCMKHEVFGL